MAAPVREPSNMTRELEERLAADFPHVFSALALRTTHTLDEMLRADLRAKPHIATFGIETLDGWYGIIRRLAEKIDPWCAATGARALQVKEKYAGLRFYLTPARDAKPSYELRDEGANLVSIAPIASNEEVNRAIDEAEEESERTCENCGAPGTEREHNYWLSTRCDDCDDPAKRFIARTENIERILKYVIKPKTAEEATMWRLALGRTANDPPV